MFSFYIKTAEKNLMKKRKTVMSKSIIKIQAIYFQINIQYTSTYGWIWRGDVTSRVRSRQIDYI